MKPVYILGSVSLLVVAAFFHAQQVWPVQNREVVGVYRNAQNSQDTIHLGANGDYEHNTGGQKFIGKWNLNKWDGDISLVNIRFKGKSEINTPYIVGSRFGRVENLYITNKSSEQWRKSER